MSGFIRSRKAHTSNDTSGDNDEEKGPLFFRDLLAQIYGHDTATFHYPIPDTPHYVDQWIDKFEIVDMATGPEPVLTCALTLSSATPEETKLTDIKISKDKIDAKLDGDVKEQMQKAFAMAALAAADADMRANGVDIAVDKPEEEPLLLLAASYYGLTVNSASPGMAQKAEQLKQAPHDAVWKEFVNLIDKADPSEPIANNDLAHEPEPESASEPEQNETNDTTKTLRTTFNKGAISNEAKNILAEHRIREEVYKRIRREVLEDQIATKESLSDNYKEACDFTNKQLNAVIQAMDAEGVTSKPEKPGQPRRVNYDEHGKLHPTIG